MARFMIMSMTAGRLWSTWLCLSVLSLATTTSPTTSSTVGGVVSAFTPGMDPQATPPSICLQAEKDNKAMAFLKKIGKVGGHHDFTHVVGIDEGSAGKHAGKGSVRTVSYSVYIYTCVCSCVCVCINTYNWIVVAGSQSSCCCRHFLSSITLCFVTHNPVHTSCWSHSTGTVLTKVPRRLFGLYRIRCSRRPFGRLSIHEFRQSLGCRVGPRHGRLVHWQCGP